MTHDIPDAVRWRMQQLEEADARDRSDGTPREQRLKQITPDVGRLLAILAAGVPRGQCIEIGTSAGYSTLWLALACRREGRKLTTFEILKEKVELARDTFRITGFEQHVHLVEGDALPRLGDFKEVAFCFLDPDKELYPACYEAVSPNLVSGGMLVADNVVSHHSELKPFLDRAYADTRVDAVVVPIGRGELICRKL